jgi:hypothetical protein
MKLKRLVWNVGKNTKLKLERGVSFEEFEEKFLKNAFKVVRNPSGNHKRQNIFLVRIRGRNFAVPFEGRATIFYLHTMFEV